MGVSSEQQIKRLLSGNVEQPQTLQIDIIKYEFSKPYVSPVQIKTEYQNANKVKTDFVRDEKVAAELDPDYDPPFSQLTYKADIQNAKNKIRKSRKKGFI